MAFLLCAQYSALWTFNGIFIQVCLNFQNKLWAVSDFLTGPSVPSIDAC